MNKKKNNTLLEILNILVIIFVIEKIIQHFLVALFFIIDIPGVGTPDIGPYFNINDNVMFFLNIINSIFFLWCLICKLKNKSFILYFIMFFTSLDIFKEFLFHGLFFITVSVIVSTLLIIITVWYQKLYKQLKNMSY